MTDDLVKRLECAVRNLRFNAPLQGGLIELLDEAIAALRERDKTRDEVLEEVARWVKGRYSHEIGEAIRALKSAPTPKIEYTGWACGRCGNPVAGPSSTCEKCGFSPKAGRRDVKEAAPFTRADGTTSPVRTGVEDRRAGRRVLRVGRRAGDRERWTGEKPATPQPEQPSLEDADLRDKFAMAALTGQLAFSPHDSFDKAHMPRDVAELAYRFADAMLDRRLAALEKK